MTSTTKSYSVVLEWIGYGPGNECPDFWTNRRIVMRYGFNVKKDGPGEAIEHARRTWHEHEAKVLEVFEINALGEPLSDKTVFGLI